MAESRKRRSRSASEPEPGSESLACPRCARRYGLDERFCAHCGMPLVYAGSPTVEEPESSVQERARKVRPELTRGDLVRVAWSRNQSEAELIQGLLLEEGVPSMLRRSPGFDVPDFLAGGPRDVLVPESGAATARAALQSEGIDPPAPPVPPAGRGHVARVSAAIVAGAGLAALVAWLLSGGA